MRVELDKTLCAAHGDCVVAAPKVFDLDDDDDFARVLDENPPESLRAEVETAVQVCPVAAIRLEG
jgi:ferredoxin